MYQKSFFLIDSYGPPCFVDLDSFPTDKKQNKIIINQNEEEKSTRIEKEK